MRVVILALLFVGLFAGAAHADFITPLIVGFLQLTGTAALVGQAIIGAGVSLGLGYLARKLQPRPSSQTQGMRLTMSTVVNDDREIGVGRFAHAGSLKYWNTYGPNGNDYLQMVFVFADHECDGLEAVAVNGELVTLQSEISNGTVSGHPVEEYPGVLWIKFHSGAWDQAADADLVAKTPGGAWPSTFRGRGVCYARVTMKFDPEKYKTGRPTFVFILRGAKLYDLRQDESAGGDGDHEWGDESTYEWSDNPRVIAYNYRRGIFVNGERLGGMNARPENMPFGAWTAAMNANDEDVDLKAGGTEKRYTAHAVIPVGTDHRTVLRELVTCEAGVEVDSGGVVKPYPGVAQSPVLSITDADLVSTGEVVHTPKLSRSTLVNAVYGSFNDPAQNYQQQALPPRVSPDDEEADGVQLTQNFALAYVTSGPTGQRITEILRRKGRFQRRITCKLRSRFCVLEAGDWVTWTSDRYGFTDMAFEVEQAALDRDLTVQVVLKETSESIYAWNEAVDELDPVNPAAVPAGGATFTTVAGIVAQNVTVTGDTGQQKPAVLVTWTPVTDATVTDLLIEYRKVGDTAAVQKTILEPESGSHLILEGIQGGVEYEVRLRPVTLPVRATVWSAWHATGAGSAGEIVFRAIEAELAEGVPPDTITPEMLSAQARFELSLVTAADDVLGALSQQIADTISQVESVSTAAIRAMLASQDNRAQIRVEQRLRIEEDLSLAEQITTAVANFNASAALVQNQITALSAVDQALASQIDTVSTTVDGQTVTVVALQQSLNGVLGKWGIAVTANGEILGLVQLEAGAVAGSTFTVVADNFKVAKPGTAGGDPIPVFSIQTVGGVTKLALRGDMIADGAIAADMIAAGAITAIKIAANAITAAKIQAGAVTAEKIAAGAITAAKIAAGEITADKIAINGLTGSVSDTDVETSPTTISSNGLGQSTYVALAGMSVNVTAGSDEKLLVLFQSRSTVSFSSASNEFQIRVDDQPIAGLPTCRATSVNGDAQLALIVPITAGAHTVKAYWRCNAPEIGRTGTCNYRYLSTMRFIR